MTVTITDGKILATNHRDSELMFLTKEVDAFLSEREKENKFHDIGIAEKCLLVGFVMWLKDNGKLK